MHIFLYKFRQPYVHKNDHDHHFNYAGYLFCYFIVCKLDDQRLMLSFIRILALTLENFIFQDIVSYKSCY